MTSLYIHIPFCKKKCNYCDFVSYAGKEDLLDSYVNALTHELQNVKLSNSLPLPKGEGLDDIETIYFGGGTPTLLSPQHFERILENVGTALVAVRNKRTGINPVPTFEISLEANPGTVSKSYLKELRQLGINRISLGAQTFSDRHLKTLGRIHNSKQIYQAVEDSRSAGFDNINLDLIFALPGQTLDEWQADIKEALSLSPEHLSTYNLQLEEGTPLFRTSNLVPRTSFLPSEETEAEMFELTIEKLTSNGYKHYEISNFARPGKECQHNVNYWKNGNYLGLGAGAHSHVNGKRWANTNSLEAYIGSVGVGRIVLGDASRVTDHVSPDSTDQRETLFMGLRLLEGLPADSFAGFETDVADLKTQGLLDEQKGKVKLTKKGLFMANLVFERFI